MSGPVPKRTAERRRRNKPDVPIVTAASESAGAPMPDPDPAWHPIARNMYVSLSKSGAEQFMEPSDWTMAQWATEWAHRQLVSSKPSAVMNQLVYQVFSDLMATEGARRRLRIELERGLPEADPAVPIMARYHLIAGGA
jgi:hypothetical protein